MIFTRITNKLMSDNIIQNLLVNRSKLNDLQEQISSGKMVTKPSQDPTSAMNILSDQTSISKMNNYIDNIKKTVSEMEVTDQALLSAVDVVHRARELTVQASNATNGADELSAINFEVEQLISMLKDVGNTQYGSKYVFGGLVTEDAPFQEAAPDGIQYMGTLSTGSYQRQVEISENILVTTNLAGDEIFGEYYETAPGPPPVMTGSGLIETLKTLSEELKSPTPIHDNIRSKLDGLDDGLKVLLDAQAKIGGAISRMELTQNKLEEDIISYTKRKSSLEDIDLAKAISDVKFQETALEASLSVSAKVIQSSLLNYL